MIIGISGKIGSGKDTVGKIIQYLTIEHLRDDSIKFYLEDLSRDQAGLYRKSNWEIKKMAGKLKTIVSLLTGCSVEDLESQEFKNKELGEEWNWFLGLTTTDGISKIRLTPTEEAKKTLPFPNRIKSYTYREMLQRIGTEAMRNKIHENVWVNALFADYKEDYGYEYTVEPIMTKEQKEKVIEAREIIKGQLDGNFQLKISKDYFPKPYNKGLPNWIITDVRFPNEAKAIEERNGILIRVNRTWRFEHGLKVVHNLTPLANQHSSETSLDNWKFKYQINNDGNIEQLIEMVKEILIKEQII